MSMSPSASVYAPIPMPFSDLSKPSNDLLSKDFPVSGTKLEVKTVAPNNVVS